MALQNDLLINLKENFIHFEPGKLKNLINSLLENGENPFDILDGLTSAIRELGEKFGRGDLFLPELMFGAKNMEDAMKMLEPSLSKVGSRVDKKPLGKIVIGAVKGDVHDIGKKIVATFLKLNGFDVFDAGIDVPVEEFIKIAIAQKAQIIGLSALLTTTMNEQRNLIKELQLRGLKSRFKVLVGGAPVTQEWADEISADAYGEDAIDAVKKAKALLDI